MENPIKELEAIYDEVTVAFQNKDLGVIERYIAPDWSGTHGDETVSRDQLMANVRNQFEALEAISWPRTISLVRSTEDEVTVKSMGPYTATQKANGAPVAMQLANEDTWRKGPEGWQNTSSKGLEA